MILASARIKIGMPCWLPSITFALFSLLPLNSAIAAKKNSANDVEKLEDLQVVDCLLPGQVRRLGASTYLTPRRPVHTTAADCRIRGGEYVEYDRADYKTALQVWLPAAETGEAEAQVNVGEIFERGLGGEPNYEMAHLWYEKAAKQGNSRAQFNLGTLYEQGKGVPADKLQAINWYRQAWGLEEDSIIYQSAAQNAQSELREKLTKKVEAKNKQISLLSKQLSTLNQELKTKHADENAQEELAQLQAWVADLEKQKQASLNELDLLPRLRQPSAKVVAQTKSKQEAKQISAKKLKFGKYYALIIGNQNYDQINDLRTPHSDSLRAKKILEEKYNFNVTMVLDADSATVMKKINEFSGELDENDNLLIFYAGHGSRIQTGSYEAGYWLPVDANPPPEDTFWVPNEFVTRHLSRIEAKRVLVVADSCYAGLLSNAPGYLFVGDQPNYSMDYVRYKLPKKSRLLISSGGDAPVLDNADNGNSIFSKAFLDVLEESNGILTGPELFLKIRDRVSERARSAGFEQTPELKAIKGAGHEVGDFFFVSNDA
jgi:hypothetical protein